jgi:hypothetical protein
MSYVEECPICGGRPVDRWTRPLCRRCEIDEERSYVSGPPPTSDNWTETYETERDMPEPPPKPPDYRPDEKE